MFGDDSLVEVDPRSAHVVARIHACAGPQGLAYAAGQLWVGCTSSGELIEIATAARRVVRRIPYDAADGVAFTGSVFRVTSDRGPSTGIVVPHSRALSGNLRLSDVFIGDANADVAEAGDGVWVSSPDEGTLYKIPRS